MRTLGFDPGYGRTGWGIVDTQLNSNQLTTSGWGVIETKSNTDIGFRLDKIYKMVLELFVEYKPNVVIMEKLIWKKSTTTAAGVFQAQGAILAALGSQKMECLELTPTAVKKGITGSGKASKQDVEAMVSRILGVKEKIKPDDAADALAIAVVGLQHFRMNELIKSQTQVC